MSSLTPEARRGEATSEAMWEGGVSGLMTLLPSTTAVYLAMRNNETFLKRTNMQSRTALAIMPALFMFAWTAEEKLTHKMKEIAKETEHQQHTVRWAEQQALAAAAAAKKNQKGKDDKATSMNKEAQLLNLYRQSVENSGVRIVPGDELAVSHRVSNFVAANPLKVLLGLAIPSVALIFYGRTGKEHLQMSVKILHTRVFGQFTTLSLLLGVMGFKEYMDNQGKFITQAEADERVQEMKRVRESLLQRLDYENQQHAQQHDKLVQAHNEVEADKAQQKKAAAAARKNEQK